MESTAETIDSLLASLMSMGFDHSDCQEAIRMGKLSLNDAVEWILSGKPKASSSGHLILYPSQTSSSSIEFPSVAPCTTNPSNVEKQVEELENKTIEEPTSPPIRSRYAASREDRGKIQDKKRLKLEAEIKLDKKNQLKVRENVLKEIECDRKAQRKITESVGAESKPSSSFPSGSVASQSKSCLIQIRLPNSSSIRHKFSADQNVSNVIEFLKDKIPTDSEHVITLLQPFPRLELKSDDSTTLAQLGLCPSCTLVARIVPVGGEQSGINIVSNSNVDPSNYCEDNAIGDLSSLPQLQQALGQAPVGQRYSWNQPVVPQSPAVHFWPRGGGHRLGYDNEDQPEELHPAVEQENQRGDNEVLSSSSDEHEAEEHQPLEGDEDFQEADIEVPPVNSHVWGLGRSLGDDETEENDNGEAAQEPNDNNNAEVDVQARRELMMQALEERLQQQPSSNLSETESRNLPLYSEQNIASLFTKSLKVLLQRLDASGKENLSTFGYLPLPVATQILKELIKRKKLNPNTILLLRSCLLIKLKLDYYPYATNHLLKAGKVFRGLRILSLRSCSLLTDKGMEVLKSFQLLRYLDIAGCVQLTDNTLTSLQDCRELTHLSVDSTRITDVGLAVFLRRNGTKLTFLSIRNLPGVSEKSLNFDLNNLQVLYIDSTNVMKLKTPLECAPNIQHLSLSGCSLYHDQFQYFDVLKTTLISLNVAGVTSLRSDSSTHDADIGDFVMKTLQSLTKLQKLDFNFRHSLTSVGIKYLESLPLTVLDLSHHRSIDDAALANISRIESLKMLDLSNTNIANGLKYLTPLLSSLIELVLNKTPVTSQGVQEMLQGLNNETSALNVLSLQMTRVDNALLRHQVLNRFTPQLVTLNLKNTKVSDSGLRYLVLPSLTSLILNDTRVRVRSKPERFPGCPSLKNIFVNSDITMMSSTLESDSDDNVS